MWCLFIPWQLFLLKSVCKGKGKWQAWGKGGAMYKGKGRGVEKGKGVKGKLEARPQGKGGKGGKDKDKGKHTEVGGVPPGEGAWRLVPLPDNAVIKTPFPYTAIHMGVGVLHELKEWAMREHSTHIGTRGRASTDRNRLRDSGHYSTQLTIIAHPPLETAAARAKFVLSVWIDRAIDAGLDLEDWASPEFQVAQEESRDL